MQESNYQGPTSITSLITQESLKVGIEHMTFIVHLPQYVQARGGLRRARRG